MNVLEKILEEIDKKSDYYETDEQGREHVRMVDMVDVEEIIRSHMDEIPKCGECSRRKWYQKGYEDGRKDNGWIPVEKKLPEVQEGLEEHAGCAARQAVSAEAVERDNQRWWPASLHEPLAG